MKKYLVLTLIVLSQFSCVPDRDYNSAIHKYVGILNNGLPTTVAEDAESVTSIPIYFGGEFELESTITVGYTVTGGVFGEDYIIIGETSGDGTVTIQAGNVGEEFGTIQIQSISDFQIESNVELTITLITAPGGTSIGYPLEKSFTFTIVDDDCDFNASDYVGLASTIEYYSDGSIYPSNGSYDTEFTKPNVNIWQMDNFWDSGMVVQLEIDESTREITVVNNTWSQFGYTWNISGTGTISTCSEQFEIEFHFTSPDYQGGYDDTFTIKYNF